MKLSPPEFKILDMKEILAIIYFIFSLLFLFFWIFIVSFILVWCISLDFDLMPTMSSENILSIINIIIYILVLILDIIIYFLILVLNILLLRHSYHLVENIKVTNSEKIFLISYSKYIIIIILLDYLIKFLLDYLIRFYHFSHIALGVLVTCNV